MDSTLISTANLLISFIGLILIIISAVIAYSAYRHSEYQNRLSVRNDFQKMLLELGKILVDDPYLGSYSSQGFLPDTLNMSKEQMEMLKIKYEHFCYLRLNTFEIIFAYYRDTAKLIYVEKESFRTWKGYLEYVLTHDLTTIEICEREEFQQLYNQHFLDEINGIIKVNKTAIEQLRSSAT